MRRSLARLALAGASLLLVLGLFEGGLRLAGYEAIYEVYSKPSLFWVHDDLLGWRHEPGASGTYVGPRPWPVEFRTPIRINSLGLRGPELEPLPGGGRRVLLLGDSYVAGFEVAWDETFPVLLARALSERMGFPVQVINAGVRGYGTDQSLLWYTKEGLSLGADLVAGFYSWNDPDDNTTLHRMRRPFGKAAFARREDGGIELVGQPVPRYPPCSAWALDADFQAARFDGVAERGWCGVQTRLADHSALLTFVSLTLQRSPGLLRWIYGLGSTRQVASRPVARAGVLALGGWGPERLPPEARFAHTWALTEALAAEVRKDRAHFFLVIGAEQLPKFGIDDPDEAPFDLHPLVVAHPLYGRESLLFENDGHLNARGHRVLSEILLPVFEQRLAAHP